MEGEEDEESEEGEEEADECARDEVVVDEEGALEGIDCTAANAQVGVAPGLLARTFYIT